MPNHIGYVETAAGQRGLDIGVNATGWRLLKPFLEMTCAHLDAMNAVQFTSPFRFFQALVAKMPQGGSIIQISSVTAAIMFDDHAAYMGTKVGSTMSSAASRTNSAIRVFVPIRSRREASPTRRCRVAG